MAFYYTVDFATTDGVLVHQEIAAVAPRGARYAEIALAPQWDLLDLLVRHETEQVEQVLAVGAALRSAQDSMSADDLRALTKQRRQLTAAVTTTARSLAREHGLKVTASVADQVEATLTAAMVDAECARAVRSGLLVASLASTGVDAVDVAAAVAANPAVAAVPTTSAWRSTGPRGSATGRSSSRSSSAGAVAWSALEMGERIPPRPTGAM